MDVECRNPSDVEMPNVSALLGVAGEPAGSAIQRSNCTSIAQEILNIRDTDCRSFNNATLAVVNATLGVESPNVAFARFHVCWNVRGDSLLKRQDLRRFLYRRQRRVLQHGQRRFLLPEWGNREQGLHPSCQNLHRRRSKERQEALGQGLQEDQVLQVVQERELPGDPGGELKLVQERDLPEDWSQGSWRGWRWQGQRRAGSP